MIPSSVTLLFHHYFITAKQLWYIHTARDWDRERDWDQCVPVYEAEIFPFVQDRDRDQDPLFPIVPIPVPSSVNEPL